MSFSPVDDWQRHQNDAANTDPVPDTDTGTWQPETELQAPVPRKAVAAIRSGPYYAARHVSARVFLILGIGLMACSRTEWMHQAGHYFLPLQFSFLLGFLFVGISIYLNWQLIRFDGPARLYAQGEVLPGRILSMNLVDVPMGQGRLHQYLIQYSCVSPETGETEALIAATKPISKESPVACTYRPGDVVSLLYLPGQFKDSVTLYGLTGVSPKLGVLRLAGQELPFYIRYFPAVCFGLIFILIGFFFAAGSWYPVLDDESLLPRAGFFALAQAVLLTPVLMVFLRRQEKATDAFYQQYNYLPQPQKSRLTRFLTFVVVMIFGLMTGMIASQWGNGIGDPGAAVKQPIQVMKAEQETHYWVFRSYRVQYMFADGKGQRSHSASPEEINVILRDPEHAYMLLKPGNHGWKWIVKMSTAAEDANKPQGKN